MKNNKGAQDVQGVVISGTAFYVSPSVLVTSRHALTGNDSWKLTDIVFCPEIVSNSKLTEEERLTGVIEGD